MKMQLTAEQFEQYCETLRENIPDMTAEQARECLSNVFYRCTYQEAMSTRLPPQFAVSHSEVVQAFSNALQGRTLLLCTTSSAILFHQGDVQVPQAIPLEWEVKEFAKRLKKRVDGLKHSHALTIISKMVHGLDYHSVEFQNENTHPAIAFSEKLQAAGVSIKPFFVPSFYGNAWPVAEIEQLVMSAERMGATKEHNIFAALIDAASVTINEKTGFPSFSSEQFRAGDVIKSRHACPAGSLSECLFVWSPEHADGTVYDVEFNDLCQAKHVTGSTYRVPSASGTLTVEIGR